MVTYVLLSKSPKGEVRTRNKMVGSGQCNSDTSEVVRTVVYFCTRTLLPRGHELGDRRCIRQESWVPSHVDESIHLQTQM